MFQMLFKVPLAFKDRITISALNHMVFVSIFLRWSMTISFKVFRFLRGCRFMISRLELDWISLMGFGSEICTLFCLFDDKMRRNESTVPIDTMPSPISTFVDLHTINTNSCQIAIHIYLLWCTSCTSPESVILNLLYLTQESIFVSK